MIWKIGAVIILLGFYGIYLGKMFLQKRNGIQTNQIAKKKKKDKVYYVERIMQVAAYSIIIVEILSIIGNFSMLGTEARAIGFVLGIVGVAIFGIAVWTMRDSWRAGIPENDRTDMVKEGIYKFSRNPAFLGFDLVYTGIGLMFFNPVHMVFAFFAGLMLHLQILQEEQYLPTVFGKEYEVYCEQVCRYLGRRMKQT